MLQALRPLLPLVLAALLQAGGTSPSFAQSPPAAEKPAATKADEKPAAGKDRPAPADKAAPSPAAQSPAAPSPAATPAVPLSETQEHLIGEVDKLTERVKGIEGRLDVQRLSQEQLNEIGRDITPLIAETAAAIDRLAPRTAATKARLDQLGPKPDKAGTEAAELTKDRDTAQKAFEINDSLLKRAKALELKVQQDANYTAKRQRQLFTRSLFQRSTSILSPPLWGTVARETPGNIADTVKVFTSWVETFSDSLTGGKRAALWGLVLFVLALYWPLTRLAKRLLSRESKVENPTAWQKVLVACWTSISTAGLVIAIMYAVVYVFAFFAPADARVAPLFAALQFGIVRIAVAAGLARGILAPNRPKWRMANVDEITSDKLIRIVMGVALIISGAKIIESLNDVIGASLEFSVMARGVGALLIAAALAVALVDLGSDPGVQAPEGSKSTPPAQNELFGIVRGLVWTLILVITVAVFVGYIPFASFLVEQVTLIAAVASVLFLLVRLSDEACAFGLNPASAVGRNLVHTIGLRRETLGQLAVLLSGAARVVFFVIAAMVVAAPWGMQSGDVSSNLAAIFFGFKIGDMTISVAGITVAIVVFLLILAATRAIQNWLEERYLPQTRLDSGLRNSIRTSLGYVGFIVALSVAAANLGVDFQKLAIVAGALSVGIGFGLQSIVNNFVSGLILLWERAVRVGDWVVVGSDQGYVRKINVRSTEIETFDRAAVIVPNSNLVSGVVKNLMRTDRVGRLSIDVSVHASADPEKVRETLLDIARENEAIIALPSPQVRFTDLTASSMNFSLFCFVGDVESMGRTKSDLYFEICKQFRAAHFFDGPPADPTRISLTGLDQLEAILRAQNPAPDLEPVRPRKTG